MSYCRFIEADAYIYDDVFYGLYCASCSLSDPIVVYNTFVDTEVPAWKGFAAGYDYDKMLKHIQDHRLAGDIIPLEVDDRLIQERDCEHESEETDFGLRCAKCWRPLDV